MRHRLVFNQRMLRRPVGVKMTSPSNQTPKQYAYIELFGHTCLGPCEVREVERFGVRMCEARPLGRDGEPGAAQRFPGAAIYRERELTQDEARALAMPRMLPAPVISAEPLAGPPCATCGYGQCHCSDAERAGESSAGAPDDGTPLCEPIEEGEDDIPF